MSDADDTSHADGCCCDGCNPEWHPASCECCEGYARQAPASKGGLTSAGGVS